MHSRKKPLNAFLVSNADSIIKDARSELKSPARRLLGRQILTLGGIAMLSGCAVGLFTAAALAYHGLEDIEHFVELWPSQRPIAD